MPQDLIFSAVFRLSLIDRFTDHKRDNSLWSCLWFCLHIYKTWIFSYSMKSCSWTEPQTSNKLWSVKTSVACTSIFSNSENCNCSLESCSGTEPQTVQVITICEDVRGLPFNYSNSENFSCYLESCLIIEPRIIKVITAREVVFGLHFKSLKCFLKIQLLPSHFTITFTVRKVDHRLSIWPWFFTYFLIWLNLPELSTSTSNHTKYTRF